MPNQFNKHDIRPLSCNYKIYLIKTNVHTNLPAHGLETRNMNQPYLPTGNLSCFQKGASYSAMRIFNNVHNHITSHKNERVQFNLTM